MRCYLAAQPPGWSTRYLVDASQTEKQTPAAEPENQGIDGMFRSLYTIRPKHDPDPEAVCEVHGGAGTGARTEAKTPAYLAMMQGRADVQESEVRTFIKEIRATAAIEERRRAVLKPARLAGF